MLVSVFFLCMQEVQNEKPIATPWLKEAQESRETTGTHNAEAFKHTRAAVKAITDANLEAVSPPPLFIEKQPPSPASLSSLPLPTSTDLTTSNHPLPTHGILTIVSEDKKDEERVQQSASVDSYKQHSPLLPPRYEPGRLLKRRISYQAAQNLHSLVIPTFNRSKSVQNVPGNVFGHNIKQVEHVLQRMADAIKMDLQHEV